MKNPFAGLMRGITECKKFKEQKLRYESGIAHQLELEKLPAAKRAALTKTRQQAETLHHDLASGIVETWKSALYRGFGSTSAPRQIWKDARSLTGTEMGAERKALGLVGAKGLALIYSSDEFHTKIAKPISDYIRAIDGTLNRQTRDPSKIQNLFAIISSIDPNLANKVREEYAKPGH